MGEQHLTNEIAQRAMLIVAASIGLGCGAMALPFYSIGSLTKPLTAAYGWSRSDVQSAILFSIGIGALVSPIVGRLVERYGPRVVAISGLLGVSSSFFLAAAAGPSLLQFQLAFVLMAVIGAGSSPVAWTRGITINFDRQLGLALGLTLTGTGICAVLAPQLVTWMIAIVGVRLTLAGLGAVPLVIALPLALIAFKPAVRPMTDNVKQTSAEDGFTLSEATQTYRFWVLLSSVAFIYLAQAGIITNLVPAITDRGFTSQEAANFQGALGFSIIAGRVLIGTLIDRFWAPGVAAVVTFLPALACMALPTVSSHPAILACTIVIGVATGAELDFLAYLTARYFGRRHYAKIYSITYGALALAGGFAPFAFAASYDYFGSYREAFQIAAGLYVTGALLVLTLGRYPRFRSTV